MGFKVRDKGSNQAAMKDEKIEFPLQYRSLHSPEHILG